MKFLFDNFDILAQSPGGVEKLREMILQMAVQGKLTQYWRSENTVIESQQEEIFKSFKNQDEIKTGRKQFLKKVNQVIFEDKKTPNNWVKSQFFNFCLLKRGHDLPKRKRKKGHYIVASSGGINGYHNEYIVEEGVVIGRSGSTGKAHYIEGKHWPLNTVLYGEDYCRNNKKYVYLFLKAFDFTKYSSSTAVPTLNRNKFLNELIFIPPLAEQKQIVAKVDSLMALCDDLENQQQTKTEKKLKLNKASLHELHNSTTKQNFNKNWNHITNNFDLLYTTPENVNDLKQTILQLAVQGKLVPQNPNDEPASVLLEKIKKEKERLLKERKIKKQKPLESIKESEILFEIPEGWVWSRLNDVFDVRDGTHDSPKYQSTGVPLVTSKNLYTGSLDMSNVKYISEVDYYKIQQRSSVDINDILFAMIGSIGNPVKITTNRAFGIKNVALFKYYNKDLSVPDYLKLFLDANSDFMRNNSAGGVQRFVSLTYLRSFIVPLPPFAEQKRIVAKVHSLMALCEQLNDRIIEKDSRNVKLLNAVVMETGNE